MLLIKALVDNVLGSLRIVLRGFVDWAPLDPARNATGYAATGVLLGAVRTDADGADRLQSAVQLVRRPADGRHDVVSDGVHAQPRPASGAREFLATLLALPRVKKLLSSDPSRWTTR